MRSIRHLIEMGVAEGLRRELLTEAAGVTAQDLQDPDAHLPLAAEIALWQTLASRTADPELAIRAAEAWRLRDIGLVGYVLRFSATLGDALHRLQRYGRLFTEAVEFHVQDGRPAVALVNAHPALGAGHALAEGYRLAALLQGSRELTGARLVPASVTFTGPRPSRTGAHSRFFGCPLHFGAPSASLVFREADLALPVVGADEALAGYLSRFAEHALGSLVRGGTLRHRVRAAIWSLLGGGTPSLARVAAAVHLPPRTLQRQLAIEGSSVQQEIEQIRHTMAVALLRERTVVIEDVAFLVGYSEPSAFFRAFKRWTGMTPRRFRHSNP